MNYTINQLLITFYDRSRKTLYGMRVFTNKAIRLAKDIEYSHIKDYILSDRINDSLRELGISTSYHAIRNFEWRGSKTATIENINNYFGSHLSEIDIPRNIRSWRSLSFSDLEDIVGEYRKLSRKSLQRGEVDDFIQMIEFGNLSQQELALDILCIYSNSLTSEDIDRLRKVKIKNIYLQNSLNELINELSRVLSTSYELWVKDNESNAYKKIGSSKSKSYILRKLPKLGDVSYKLVVAERRLISIDKTVPTSERCN